MPGKRYMSESVVGQGIRRTRSLQRWPERLSCTLEVACLSRSIATVGEPAERILGGHGLQGLANGFLQRLMGPGTHASQKGFELGEGFFDGSIIRRVGRQEEQFTATRLDELTHARPFMGAEIIEHHDLSSRQTGSQDLFDVGFKGQCIDGPLR
jgi:hypothetical protein